MYLKPVRVLTIPIPYLSAIAFCSSVVTSVFTKHARPRFASLSFPCSNIVFTRYQAIKDPIWFPVRSCISPEPLRTTTPIRSQSGSVPITASACTSSARSTPIANAAAFSGFGEATVGKAPFWSSCSGTVTTSNPSSRRSGQTMCPPVPCKFV